MIGLQLELAGGLWVAVKRDHILARALADRHYSRQTPGAREFMPPGRTLVLVTPCRRAVWGVIENLDPIGALRWRCSIFRNEGAGLSSELVRAATRRTIDHWVERYRGVPRVPLTTEVNPGEVRHKRDPGRCFRKAGWVHVRTCRGLMVFEAPR